MISGNHRGTVTAMVPPGRRTRTSSSMAWMSAGMCSSTSDATTRSNSPSANGSASASPSLMSAEAPSGTSLFSFIAPKISRTPASSSASWSNAMTSAPRRYISNACRPAPQPMSMTRSPGLSPSRSKSTVSMLGDHLFVRCGRGHRHCAPAELLQNSLPCCATHDLAALRIVEQLLDRGFELADVTGRHQGGAGAVVADDLGDRAGPADDQRGGAGHQLRGREGETFIQRRDAGDLGRAHHVDELGLADAVDESHVVGDAQLVDEPRGAPTRLGDEHQLDVTLRAQLGERLEQRGDALHRCVGAGH